MSFFKIPASMAFAFLAHIEPAIGLQSAWIVGFISSTFGGRPAMISGSTGAFAVVIKTFVDEPSASEPNGEGFEIVFLACIFAGK